MGKATALAQLENVGFLSRYLLPFQIRWAEDRSRMKMWEKSVRIGDCA